ncbi:AbrB/MazE/SpoVT family DNA-binding domain-containing protein [Brevibacillus sp. H7]|uniref:AbrB/MazE/SpoVT family DNA-binding domain-containing protein n=1 Tax=Brevibacillus sp. H7 TaxID=3349138 RepID=UPI003818618F
MSHQTSKGLITVTALAQPVAKGTIRKWGNSLALRIPSEVVKLTKLGDGVEVGFHVSDKGEVVIRPVFPAADNQDDLRALFLSLRGTSKPGVRSHDESYEPVGDEII